MPLYRSAVLESVWPYGFCTVGAVTLESCGYVARYCVKKFRNSDPDVVRRHYEVVDEYGVIHQIEPEFAIMSRRPGIAYEWLQRYKGDTDKDFVTVDRRVVNLPKYYDKLLEELDADDMAKRKRERFRVILFKLFNIKTASFFC